MKKLINFFSKKDKEEIPAILEKQKPAYWEEFSYMIAFTDDDDFEFEESIFGKLNKIDDLKVKDIKFKPWEEGGTFVFEYRGEEFFGGLTYGEDFDLSVFETTQSHLFSSRDNERISKSKKHITLFIPMAETANPQTAYKMQLEMLMTLLPTATCVYDESAEKLLNIKWVDLLISSNTLPLVSDMYTTHFVGEAGSPAWLHTHGLIRFGLSELEVLNVPTDNPDVYWHLVNSLATSMMTKKSSEEEQTIFHIGGFINNEPIVAVTLSWPEALKEYGYGILGGTKDREHSHNTESSVVFLYKNEEDYEKNILTKPNELDELLQANPLFYYSDEETKIMEDIAKARFDNLKKYISRMDKNAYSVLVKLGLYTTEGEKEHIWFQLLEVDGDKIKAELTQEPYAIPNLKEGDVGIYDVNLLTDWILYTEKGQVQPSGAYLLELED